VIKESKDQYQQIEKYINYIDGNGITNIKGQPSLLIAPDISNTESAIPIRAFAHFLDKIGLGVLPTREQTMCFIDKSKLFKLTGLISFERDTIAGSITDASKDKKHQENSDVLFLSKQLEERCQELANLCPVIHQELEGKHLEPLGNRIGDYIVDLNPFDKFVEPIKHRFLEHFATKFLVQLNQRRLLLDQQSSFKN
jgi:hypothetical protein